MSVSFGFKKKIENKVTGTVKNEDNEEKLEYLKTVDHKTLKPDSKNPNDFSHLIIPLITRNRYAKPPVKSANDQAKPKEANKEEDDIQEAAVKEIIEESSAFMENSENQDEDQNMAVPLLLKNQVPDGFETDDRLDVSLRPDQASDADYEQIPVMAFGMAVLRGMGWNAEEGIGRTFKQHVKPVEQQVRPKGLGLGADVPKPVKNIQTSNEKNNKNENEEVLKVEKGSYVFILTGSLKNKYGIIQSVDIETARFIVRMAIGGKSEQVSQHSLQVVSKREYEQNAKYIGKLKKDDVISNIIGNGHHKKEEEKMDCEPSTSKRKWKDISEEKSEVRRHSHHGEKKKHKKSSRRNERSPDELRKEKKWKDRDHKSHDELSSRPAMSWVRPQMRTRIIDRSYKKGRYYLQKVIIEDVLGKGRCCCKTEDGKLLDDIKDSMLETVIPKSNTNAYVIIVRSQRGVGHDGKLAQILEKDKSKSKALVQLIEDRDVVVKLNFEEICEYTGDVESDLMF